MSSPHHHQGNGKAEAAVKVVKNLLRKARLSGLDPYDALLDQRNTPTIGLDSSPAQTFLARRVNTKLPMKVSLLKPEVQKRVLEKKEVKLAEVKKYYDKNAKDLPTLKKGDIVRVRPEGVVKGQEWKKGTVVKSNNFRSYDVLVNGTVLKRNRVQL